MSRCCVAYIANEGYLFSTLLSATQAMRNVSKDLADVVIFIVGGRGAESAAVERACSQEGIVVQHVDPAAIEGMHIYFARLLIDRFLPPIYDQVLYIDGDTQIVGSLDPLVTREVLPGRVVAARDPLALLAGRDGSRPDAVRARWTGLGLSERDFPNYVNSGVLRFNRNGWAELAERSIAAYKVNPGLYKFPDQDLVNTIARDRLDYASLAWNFPGFFLAYGLQKVVQPRIIHFMANPRPWHGPLPDFRQTWHRPYVDLIEAYPETAPYRPQLSRRRYLKYILQQHFIRTRDRMLWGRSITRVDLARSDRAVMV